MITLVDDNRSVIGCSISIVQGHCARALCKGISVIRRLERSNTTPTAQWVYNRDLDDNALCTVDILQLRAPLMTSTTTTTTTTTIHNNNNNNRKIGTCLFYTLLTCNKFHHGIVKIITSFHLDIDNIYEVQVIPPIVDVRW